MRRITMASTVASPRAGLLRAALAGVVALLVGRAAYPGTGGAYVVAALGLLYGLCCILGRPEILLRDRSVQTVLDAGLVGALIAYTGGGGSPYFALYLLAALGIAWIEAGARVFAASAAMVGGYLIAVFAAGGAGAIGSPRVILGAGLLALFCAVVGSLGSEMHGFRRLAVGLSSTLAKEIDRVESDEEVISRLGPVLKVLSLEGVLGWSVETAHAVAGGPYAHVAALHGNHHSTAYEGESDVCPSWWHPSIQRLVLLSCREGDTVRSEETVHSIEGFMAVPVGPEDERWGAVIVGGGNYGAEEERVLKLLARGMAPALENAEDAPGGLDQLTGLPNRASLYHVLRREVSGGRSLTVLVMGLPGFRDYERTRGPGAGDVVLRRIGERLENGRQRAFRYGDDRFVVLLGGTGEGRARKLALALRQHAAEETRGLGDPSLSASVGFAFVETGEDAGGALDAALRLLEEAEDQVEGIAGPPEGAGEGSPEGDPRIAGITRALVEALEAKDPYIGEHLRAVARVASRIGRRMAVSGEDMEALVDGALLHDIGKIGIPDRILQKAGLLTEEEYEVIKHHPAMGAEIIGPVRELAPALPAVKHHHERFDGKGYPDGLRGEEIPLIVRIVSVADAFDSMIRPRPYGYNISETAALEELSDNSGTQFDPRVVKTLLEVVDASEDRRADSAG